MNYTFDSIYSPVVGARFWIQKTVQGTSFRYGLVDPAVATSTDLKRIIEELNSCVNLKGDEPHRASYLQVVNGCVERHNTKLQTVRIKIWTWLLHAPLARTILALFLNVASQRKKCVPYRQIDEQRLQMIVSLSPLSLNCSTTPSQRDVPPLPDISEWLSRPSWEDIVLKTEPRGEGRRAKLLDNDWRVIAKQGPLKEVLIWLYHPQFPLSLGWDLPDLNIWKGTESKSDIKFVEEFQGGNDPQILNFYRNWARTHWKQEEIDRRFWGIVAQGEKRTYFYGSWFLRLLSPLISPIASFRKTVENFTHFAERLDHHHEHLLPILKSLLEGSQIAQTDAAAQYLQSSHCTLVLWLLEKGADGSSKEVLKVQLDHLLEKPLYVEKEPIVLEILARLIAQNSSVGQLGGGYLQKIYTSLQLSRQMKMKVLTLLIYHGAQVSNTLLGLMKQDFLRGELSLLPVLHLKGSVTSEEFKAYSHRILPGKEWEKCTVEVLETEFTVLCPEVESMARRSNLAQDAVDFSKVTLWRRLKKIGKQKSISSTSYKRFCKAYLSLISKHPLLQLLREISQNTRHVLRKHTAVAQKTITLIGVWGQKEEQALTQEDAAFIIKQDPQLFEGIRSRILNVATRYFSDFFWSTCRKLWLHGTKSAIFAILFKMNPPLFLGAGTLLKRGIAPPCGVLCGSHTEINEKMLCGVIAANNWDVKNGHHRSASNFLIPIRYATKKDDATQMRFNPEEAWKNVSVEHVKQTIANKDIHTDIPWLAKHTEILVAILRLRMTDKGADERLIPLKKWLHDQNTDPRFKEIHAPLVDAIEMALNLFLDAADLEKVTNPYPILFGCPDKNPLPHSKLGALCEYLLPEGFELGKDVKVAFTLPEHIPQLKKDLSGRGVKVDEVEMVRLIETMEMLRGSQADPALLRFTNPREAQIKLNLMLQRDILPFYAAKLPEVPSGPDREPMPDYAQYVMDVEKGLCAPRLKHDPMHAARATFISQLLVKYYIRHGTLVQNPILVGVSTGFHDSARQDEKKDLDEAASAANADTFLQRFGLRGAELEACVRAIAQKDPPDSHYEDAHQEIVHNADSLEMCRFFNKIEKFDKSFLSFTKMAIPHSNEELDPLIQEVYAFIQQTEDTAVKKELAETSSAYYLDLLDLFKKTHFEKQCYPHLYELAKDFL